MNTSPCPLWKQSIDDMERDLRPVIFWAEQVFNAPEASESVRLDMLVQGVSEVCRDAHRAATMARVVARILKADLPTLTRLSALEALGRVGFGLGPVGMRLIMAALDDLVKIHGEPARQAQRNFLDAVHRSFPQQDETFDAHPPERAAA